MHVFSSIFISLRPIMPFHHRGWDATMIPLNGYFHYRFNNNHSPLNKIISIGEVKSAARQAPSTARNGIQRKFESYLLVYQTLQGRKQNRIAADPSPGGGGDIQARQLLSIFVYGLAQDWSSLALQPA